MPNISVGGGDRNHTGNAISFSTSVSPPAPSSTNSFFRRRSISSGLSYSSLMLTRSRPVSPVWNSGRTIATPLASVVYPIRPTSK